LTEYADVLVRLMRDAVTGSRLLHGWGLARRANMQGEGWSVRWERVIARGGCRGGGFAGTAGWVRRKRRECR